MTDIAQNRTTRIGASSPVPAPPPPARPRFGTLAGRAAWFTAGIGIVLVGAHAVSIPTPPCPLRWTTGFPCPFCGLTHVARELLTGQVGLVLRHDPAGLVLAIILAAAVATQGLALLRRRPGGPAYMTSRIAGFGLVAVLAAHWVTTIVTGGMFTA